VGDLGIDTAVTQVSDGRWRARLSEDWNVWGPNGGYVASVCLRAAGAACGLARPATIACSYLAVGQFGDVDLEVDVLRATRRTAAVRVHMSQDGKGLAECTVWAVADGIDGYTWNDARPPEVSGPQNTPTLDERWDAEPGPRPAPHAMAQNFEQRPLDWMSQEEITAFGGGQHEACTWMRYVPTPVFGDRWIDACRPLILVDTWAWAAAVHGLPGAERGAFLAPNLDVTARFHADVSTSEWLLVTSRAPFAGDGLIGAEVAVWSESRQLAASGGAQLLCRPGPSASST